MDGGTGSKSLGGATGVDAGWVGSVSSVDSWGDGDAGDSPSEAAQNRLVLRMVFNREGDVVIEILSNGLGLVRRTSKRRAKVANILSCWARKGYRGQRFGRCRTTHPPLRRSPARTLCVPEHCSRGGK